MQVPVRYLITAMSIALLAAGGCSSGGTTTTGGTTPEGDAGPVSSVNDPTCEAQVQLSQTVSQRCCQSYGLDACGPDLVCAGLDGHKVATCYVEGSRKPGESCTTDTLCTSATCLQGTCAPGSGNACDGNGMCANNLVCASAPHNLGRPNVPTCEDTKHGTDPLSICNTCIDDSTCGKDTPCIRGTCKYASGQQVGVRNSGEVNLSDYLDWVGARCCVSGTATGDGGQWQATCQ